MAMVTSKDGKPDGAALGPPVHWVTAARSRSFGTDEQKMKYFPRLGEGGRSRRSPLNRGRCRLRPGEPGPSRPTPDGLMASTSCSNGEKLWTTNGTTGRASFSSWRSPPDGGS